MKGTALLMVVFLWGCGQKKVSEEEKRLTARARRVIIIRDDRGIPHVYAKTDADAVFGVLYAQCEESFERVEQNYIEKLGRVAELKGKDYLLQDLKMRLLYDTAAAIADYRKSPPWLKQLLTAFSDGIHYYLFKHPEVKPRLLTRFEPWFPLLFTDGAYIATQTGGLLMTDIAALYNLDQNNTEPEMPTGSNGFALGPSKTADKNTLLYINPHVSFYFRTEMHMVSEEGLNAYGAVTWGQFFVFQGFNEHCGWMHTSSAVDAADLYAEKIIQQKDSLYYVYDGSLKPVKAWVERFHFLENGKQADKSITVYATHHGPVIGKRGDTWLSLRAQNRSLNGLIQSWQRTKAKDLAEFILALQLKSNASTNTVYADNQGNIAYWHGNFVPKRAMLQTDIADGSTSQSEWTGVHELNELPHVVNPASGFIQNCNSSPLSLAGYGTLKGNDYPAYMKPEQENFRSVYAIQQLSKMKAVTMDSLMALGYSTHLSAMDSLLPVLFRDYEHASRNNAEWQTLKEVMDTLKAWDHNIRIQSVASTLGIFWSFSLLSKNDILIPEAIKKDHIRHALFLIQNVRAEEKLQLLKLLLTNLESAYGTWKVPWGEINRFQRLNGSTNYLFSNQKESEPVGLGPAYLGCLPSFETVWEGGKQYGVAGNSFVAVVSFGKKIRAKSISTAGQSFDPSSHHFKDQVEGFLSGKLKDVYFYKDDVLRHGEKQYHP